MHSLIMGILMRSSN